MPGWRKSGLEITVAESNEGQAVESGGNNDPPRECGDPGKRQRGPSGAFVGALLGSGIGFLLMPPHVNWRATDADVLTEMLWIMGGAGIGGILGAAYHVIRRGGRADPIHQAISPDPVLPLRTASREGGVGEREVRLGD
jgi:hypothetical protein